MRKRRGRWGSQRGEAGQARANRPGVRLARRWQADARIREAMSS